MSTVEVGTAFEDRVFAAVKKELHEGRLGFDVSRCQLKQHASYFSRDRGKSIRTDISIEVWRPGAATWSFLWVWECKFRKGAVTVEAVQRLKTELDQIASSATKGAIAISGAIQDGALNYAESHKLAVIRLLPDEQIEHVLTYGEVAPAPTEEEAFQALTDPEYIGTAGRDFYARDSGRSLESWNEILRATLEQKCSAS